MAFFCRTRSSGHTGRHSTCMWNINFQNNFDALDFGIHRTWSEWVSRFQSFSVFFNQICRFFSHNTNDAYIFNGIALDRFGQLVWIFINDSMICIKNEVRPTKSADDCIWIHLLLCLLTAIRCITTDIITRILRLTTSVSFEFCNFMYCNQDEYNHVWYFNCSQGWRERRHQQS